MAFDLGYERVQAVVASGPLKIRWTASALADLDRFASFLHLLGNERLANDIAGAIRTKTRMIADNPKIGRPIGVSQTFRELAFAALRGHYVLRYRLSEQEITIMRVFHSREDRS